MARATTSIAAALRQGPGASGRGRRDPGRDRALVDPQTGPGGAVWKDSLPAVPGLSGGRKHKSTSHAFQSLGAATEMSGPDRGGYGPRRRGVQVDASAAATRRPSSREARLYGQVDAACSLLRLW